MLTQTSVYTKSAPRTPACTSSVTVTRAPLCSAAAWAALTTSGGGVSAGGAAIRTSMPSRALVTSSKRATLLRPSPVKQ